jgi:hypothetical protein
MEKADPIYVNVNFIISENNYRYMKIRLNNKYQSDNGYDINNLTDRFSFHELEVFVKY